MMKEIRWIGNSKQRLREFPDEAMDEAGHQLRRVQRSLQPADWKPLGRAGLGVVELRIHCPREYRVMYIAEYAKAIYVLHACGKKTEKTPLKDLEIARRAYAEVQKKRPKIS